MKCPCGKKTDVIDSRWHPESASVRRRHECPDCGDRFSTLEVILGTEPVVVTNGRPIRVEDANAWMRERLGSLI